MKKLTKQQRINVINSARLFYGLKVERQAAQAAPITAAQWAECDPLLAGEVVWNFANRDEAVVLKTSADSQRARAGWPKCKFVYVRGGNPENAQAYCNAAAEDLKRLRIRIEKLGGYFEEKAKADPVATEIKRIEKLTIKQQARLRAALGW